LKTFLLGRRWISHQRKSNSARCNTLHIKIIELIWCARRLLNITKSHLNDRICQHCGVKISTVSPSFYYVFNTYLSCNNSIRSFMGNLWRVLLLGNHLKLMIKMLDISWIFKLVGEEIQLNLFRKLVDFSYKEEYYGNEVVIHNCQRLHIDPFPQICLTSVNPVYHRYPH